MASLERARALGDRLVVGVNSDASTRRLKGPSRPFQSEEDRVAILASLRFVDAVTIFEEDTPELLIQRLLPDVLAKGADYSEDQIAGAEAVKRAGGSIALIDLEPGLSSTELVRRIQTETLPDR